MGPTQKVDYNKKCFQLPSEKPQSLEIFQNVRRLRGDEQHVELLDRLIDVADRVGLDEGVLPDPAWHQLWKGRQETFDPGLRHLNKLAREKGLATLGANCSCQQNLLNKKEEIFTFIGFLTRRFY